MFELCYQYEFRIPVKNNDGSRISQSRFYKTKTELSMKYGGCNFYPAKGLWKYYEMILNEDVMVIQITVEKADDEFMEKYCDILKERFKQVEIYLQKTPVFIFKSQKTSSLTSKESTGESSK